MNALVVLAEGFEDIEAVTVVDVLRRGGVDVVTASLSGAPIVKSAHGIEMLADLPFEKAAADSYSAIVRPGGGGGTENMSRSPALLERIRRQKGEGGLICAICAAPTILVKAGILEPDQHITCYPSYVRALDRPCAEAPVVADGDVITGQAPGSALLFALVVLKSLVGDYVARRVAEGMVTDVM